MNKNCFDTLLNLFEKPYSNQRNLAKECQCSLGNINKSLAFLKDQKLIDENYLLTEKGVELIKNNSPENAIILAAGRGMRMVPINLEAPKPLLEINKIPLIEYQIQRLQETGINKIYIVVGFLKEKFEYLIDKYGVNLIVNMQYDEKNNLFSLYKAVKYIGNTYIVPADLYFTENPFSKNEAYSWYMLSDEKSKNSDVSVNRKSEIVKSANSQIRMVGISYIANKDKDKLVSALSQMATTSDFDNSFWEDACFFENKMFQYAKFVKNQSYCEINTYEDLRNIDIESDNLRSDAINIIQDVLECSIDDIHGIKPLKKGMTNRSFLFYVNNKKYIMRIPGEGTDKLIDRKAEAEVYSIVNDKDFCDNVIYINPTNGYKISEFIENARVCDSSDTDDLKKCMAKLRELHNLNLKVNHTFDLFRQIDFYEELRGDTESVYRDYLSTKENVCKLKKYIDSFNIEYKLTHIDAVPDNFLFYNGDKEIRLIDWEYSAMQDPHVDLAMFSIYSFFDKKQIDQLIDIYFENNCSDAIRTKIYCYVAICGLLWSNWCEYKLVLGVEFGEYSIKQYRYAKEFYKIATEEIDKLRKGE